MRILAYFFVGTSCQVWKPYLIHEEQIGILQLGHPSEKMTFSEAKKTCDQYGGKLPVPKNPIVNESFDSKSIKTCSKN